MADKRLDDCLSTRGGHLFVEECDTLELLRLFGTPLFVLSEDQIRRNVRRFQAAFQAGWPDGPVKVLPAAKANWIPAVQCILAGEGCGCDVYSPGELSVALRAGFPRELISVNGVPKDREHIVRSVAEGVRLTIDSVEELDVIHQAAQDLGRTARVRLRLKPAISGFAAHRLFGRGAGAHRRGGHGLQGPPGLRRRGRAGAPHPGDGGRRAGGHPRASRSMSNFNAMPWPATVLVTGSRAAVVRRRETEEDVFRRDLLPEHLQGGERTA